MNDYIVVLKLVNGLDVVAVIVDESDHIIEVEFPFTVTYNSAAGGAIFKPFCLFTDEHNFRFRTDSVITISKASNNVVDYYTELTKEYSEYVDKKHSIDDLNKLFDELGIDEHVNEDEETYDSYDTKTFIEGNDTKH